MYCDNCGSHDIDEVPPYGWHRGMGVRCNECGYYADDYPCEFTQIKAAGHYVDAVTIGGTKDDPEIRVQLMWFAEPLFAPTIDGNPDHDELERHAEEVLLQTGVVTPEHLACPTCGERGNRNLEVLDNYFNSMCHTCGTRYNPLGPPNDMWDEPWDDSSWIDRYLRICPAPPPDSIARAGDGMPDKYEIGASVRVMDAKYKNMVFAVYALLELILATCNGIVIKSSVNVYVSWLQGGMDIESCAAALQSALNAETRRRNAKETGVSL